jgi:uncharacterized protein (TIGR02391 family)
MPSAFRLFEAIVRSAADLAYAESKPILPEHPFDQRNISSAFPSDVRQLFDNGHYSQSTFEAYKYVDKEVARLAGSSESGVKLMMAVLSEGNPIVRLTPCITTSEKDEQKGYQFLFAGSTMAIRNPRGHQYAVKDSPDDCLDHLSLASMLLRRLEAAGFELAV